MSLRRTRPAIALVLTLAALAAPASASAVTRDLLSTTVTATGALDDACHSRLRAPTSDGVVQKSVTSPAPGWISAQLEGDGPGDWDVAIFQTDTNRLVAGSAAFGAIEHAQGVVGTGAPVTVQACRRDAAAARTAKLNVTLTLADASKPHKVQLASVSVPNRFRFAELERLGLNMADHGHGKTHDVVLYGPDDHAKLRRAKFTYVVEVDDLIAHDTRNRARDRANAPRLRQAGTRALPSGRTGPYRRLPDYQDEMKKLVEENPGLVKPIQLPLRSYEGRPVEGVEISTNVNARDGKPIFLNMGTHHAREWPSAEHSLEWAYEMVNGFRSGNTRVQSLLDKTRVIVIPVINPDGFNISREAGEAQLAGDGRGDPIAGGETANIVAHPLEYRRKNCRLPNDAPAGSCATFSQGVAEPGVDPNRNYGGFWGGPGASTDPTNLTYRGPGPFSEPETQNVRDLMSKRQVTTMITNHTFSALVLRPPGLQIQGAPPDEDLYKALGDTMAAENGYLSQRAYQLYDTTGTTEDWSYYATGGLGFTFEIGCKELDREGGKCDAANFHPPYVEMIAEYEGTSPLADDLKPDGLGNREAYFKALEHTADASKHSVLEGSAPVGAVLRLKKSFKTETFPQEDGKPIELDDTLETVMDVPLSGRFEWHINPSTRPVVAKDKGREATGQPSPPEEFDGGVGHPDDGAAACGDAEDNTASCTNDHPFTVPSGAGIDNARATIRIEWATLESDWDMRVFHDVDGDGAVEPGDEEVGSSQQGTTDYEETTITEPVLKPGDSYVVRVNNFLAAQDYAGKITYGGPADFVPARTESWTLTCERPNGEVLSTQQITIGRGQRQTPDLGACAARFTQPGPPQAGTTACATAAGFRSVATQPRGRRVRLAFARRESQPVNVDIFQVALGRRVIGERLVTRFRSKTSSFEWNGRGARSGYLFARYSMRLPDGRVDVRRKVLRFVNGRFSNQPDFYRRESCALLGSYKLERPVFGGRNGKSLGIAYRVTDNARVRLEVLRGSQTIKTLANEKRVSAGRTYRARTTSRGLRAGNYKIRITVRQGSRRVTSTLVARRL
jgi:hypothetical protein